MVKKLMVILAVFSLVLTACQNEDKKELSPEPEAEKVPDSIQTLSGQFIYVADAAVLRGEDFIYEVKIDSMAQQLADQVKPYKKEDFDMVPVKIRGKVSPNTRREGLDEMVEIREILDVSKDKDSITEQTEKK